MGKAFGWTPCFMVLYGYIFRPKFWSGQMSSEAFVIIAHARYNTDDIGQPLSYRQRSLPTTYLMFPAAFTMKTSPSYFSSHLCL